MSIEKDVNEQLIKFQLKVQNLCMSSHFIKSVGQNQVFDGPVLDPGPYVRHPWYRSLMGKRMAL